MSVLSSTPSVSQTAYEDEIEHHLKTILPAFDDAKPDSALLVLLSLHEILHNMLNADLVSLKYCHKAWTDYFAARFTSLGIKLKAIK